MNDGEARSLVEQELIRFREMSYEELTKLIGAEPYTAEVTAKSGSWYQIEIEVFRDSKRGGNVRVLGAIDDGGWRSFRPLTSDFIKSQSGRFVGE